MDRLTSFDTSFLLNEKANGHMAIGALLVCDGPAPSHQDCLDQVNSRLHLLPRLRQRLTFPPLGLGTPFWVDYPEFEVTDHVRRIALPTPGGEKELRTLVNALLTPPLDRARPLWEVWVVDEFAEDRFAIVYRTHHAMADGLSVVDIATLLADIEPNREPSGEVASWNPCDPPSRAQLGGRALWGLWVMLRRTLAGLLRVGRHPHRAARGVAYGVAGLGTWALARPAPNSPLNVDIGPRRCFHMVSADLGVFKQVKNVLGGTVNDVALTVVAGALRRWLLEGGFETDGLRLRALVPVSIRAEDEQGNLGNRLTAMRGPLPVQVADPIKRLRFISAAMDDLKASRQAFGVEALWGINDWFREFTPPSLLAPTAAANFATRFFNLLVTNLRGPQTPAYILGRELTDAYPVGFLAKRHALSIAVVSYNGSINFGLLADPDALEGVERIASYVEAEVEELATAASGPMEDPCVPLAIPKL